MSGPHTAEPWGGSQPPRLVVAKTDNGWSTIVADVTSSDGRSEANAARIVACVNACAGIPTPELSTLLGEVRGVLDDLARHDFEPHTIDPVIYNEICRRACALLAKLPVQS